MANNSGLVLKAMKYVPNSLTTRPYAPPQGASLWQCCVAWSHLKQ